MMKTAFFKIFGCVQTAHNTKSFLIWCNVDEFRQKTKAYLTSFGVLLEVVTDIGDIL